MLFCLKEHNSVVSISCADAAKFRLPVLCSVPLTPGASSVSFQLLFLWNTSLLSTRDHSKEHPPTHGHLLVGFPAARKTPALVSQAFVLNPTSLDRAEGWASPHLPVGTDSPSAPGRSQPSTPLLAILVSPRPPATGECVTGTAPVAPCSAWQGWLGSPPHSCQGSREEASHPTSEDSN